MSTSGPDIPLYIIVPLSSSNRGHHQDTHPESTERRMHSHVLRAAAARSAGKSFAKGKGKTREQYPDESDEEATLLGNVGKHEEGDINGEDAEESTQMKRLQVSRVRPFILVSHLCAHADPTLSTRSHHPSRGVDIPPWRQTSNPFPT
ncbi:hypothetical protein F5141DRAFT_244790 [Pisolithus sp. B1]|nr:hypothetical protein F5141DRAFT_244790 [Pisolithus sp. B1]